MIVEQLQQSDIFGSLDAGELARLAPLFREAHYAEGEILFTEGAPADRLFVIVQGKISLEKKIQLGRGGAQRARTATTGYVEAGKTAGWSGLIPLHTYTTAAIAIEPTQAIIADGAQLQNYLEQNPAAGFLVMRKVAELIGSRYKQATDTLTYFVSIVSHELRAPLAAIENYLNVMLDGFAGEVSSKQRRMLERSASRVNDLRSLIGDVVDLARMRPEQIQADFEPLDPAQVGIESIEDVRLAAAEKNIKIKVERPPEFFNIVGARRRMRQVFTNLLTNAIKFSPEGSTVTFRAYYTPDTLVFEVEDEGIGIPVEDQPHIFKDFFRADNVGSVSGLGLGLSIAKKIIDAHQGQIAIQSPYSPNKGGTRFVVSIPHSLPLPKTKSPRQGEENSP